MKHLFSAFILCLLFAVSGQAQNFGAMGVGDTITTSSSTDTGYLYVGTLDVTKARLLSGFNKLEMNIRLDSLSGGTAGVVYVEYSNATSPTEIGDTWYRPAPEKSSLTYNGTTTTSTSLNQWTINGVTTLITWEDDNFCAKFARFRLLTGSSSASTRMRGWYSLR